MSPTAVRDFVEDLRTRTRGEVRASRADRLLYSTDASIYKQVPLAVFAPKTVDDVHGALDVCRARSVPITARGAGTSLEGQAIGPGLVVDFSRHLHRVHSIDAEARTAVVQPGVVQEDIGTALAKHGLIFGPDTATADRGTLGGMVGNNSSGARSIVYGVTVDELVGVRLACIDGTELVLGEVTEAAAGRLAGRSDLEGRVYAEALRIRNELAGEVERRFPRILRRVAGYNFDQLVRPGPMNMARAVCGSEGTLGLLTEVTISLTEPPAAVSTALVHFDDLHEAMIASVVAVEELGPSAVELVDGLIVDLAKRSPTYRPTTRLVVGDARSLLIVEFFGESESEAASKLAALRRTFATRGLGRDLVELEDARDVADAWALRKAGLPLLMSLPGDAKPIAFIEDCSVPVQRLPEYVRSLEEIFAHHGVRAGMYAHASVGCIHVRPILDLHVADGVNRMRSISTEVCELAVSLGGSISGEHGDGYAKSEHLVRQYGPALVSAFGRWKRAFDPVGLMNPGKIVDPEPLDSHLRLGPGKTPPAIRTHLDFTAEGGFAAAAQLCNGNAACRKMRGTMCPSYMATRDERDTTRARANLLSSIADGTLPAEALTDDSIYEVMELCVECKGCRSECPTGVDVAKLKTEFMAHYRAEHGVPLRARIFSDPAVWFRRLRPVAPLLNVLGNAAVARPLKARLGVAPQRPIPRVARRGFRARFEPPVSGRRGAVSLFVDTYTEYLYPWIGEAAVRVLGAMGYGVSLLSNVCCGRPLFHEGLLDEARARMWANFDVLREGLDGAEAVIVLEPSCASVLVEDGTWLVPEARDLSDRVRLFESFVADHGSSELFEMGEPVLLHGHCHAKSLWGIEPTVRALSLVPGTQVHVVDSGCCGLAGSFGFDREHYDVSMAMGERSLFPAVRAGERTVIAPGTSCRQQIMQGTGRTSLHPAEYLAAKLSDPSEGCRR